MKTLCLIIMLGLISTVALTIAEAQRQRPLKREQIENLLKNRTSDEAIAREINQDGLDFKPDAEFVKKLRGLGAGPETIKAIEKRLPKVPTPTPTPLPKPTPTPIKPERIGEPEQLSESEKLGLLGALEQYRRIALEKKQNGPPPVPTPTPTRRPVFSKSEAEKLIGVWQADVYENGRRVRIIWRAKVDGTSEYFVTSGTRTGRSASTWRYSDGVLHEKFPDGSGAGEIKWINDDYFILTILYNQSSSGRELVRHYHRK